MESPADPGARRFRPRSRALQTEDLLAHLIGGAPPEHAPHQHRKIAQHLA